MADPTRESAFDLLTAVLERHRPLEEALDALPAAGCQGPRRRASPRRRCAARMGTLDAVLEPFLRKEPPDPVRNVLRIGAAGLLLLDTPSHAAVATAVSLAKRRGLTPFAGLVNAVLRKVATAGPDALGRPELGRASIRRPGCGRPGGRAPAPSPSAHQAEAPLDVTLKPGVASARGRDPVAHRIGPLPGRHPGIRHSRFRIRRPLGAGRRRGAAGSSAGSTARRTHRRSLCRARRQNRATRRCWRDCDRDRARRRSHRTPDRQPAADGICTRM